jgi:O-antigen/teichoic acid export membrane protein
VSNDGKTESIKAAPQQSLTMSALWLMAAKGFGFVLGIAFPLLMVRRLDKVELGHYNQVFQLATTLCGLLPFGFAMTAFYFFPREPERRGAVCLNILLVCGGGGLLAGTGLMLFPSILPSIFREPALLPYSPEVAVLIPLWIVGALLETFPVVMQEFRLATLLIVGLQLSRAVLMISATVVFGSVHAIVLAAILNALLQSLFLGWYLEARLPGFWRGVDWELLRSQLRYAAPFGLAGVLYILQGDLHNYFVSRAFGAVAFAVYSVGCVDLPLIGILAESANSVLLRRVSEMQLAGDTAGIIAVIARVARKLSLVFFPVYAFLMVAGRELITIVYTSKFRDSWPIFRINCTILLLSTLLLDPVFRCYPSRMSLIVKVRVALFIAMTAALWFFVGRFGPVSAIVIVICRTAVENIFTAAYYSRVLGMTRHDLRQFTPMLRIAVCSATAAALTFAFRLVFHGLSQVGDFIASGVFFCLLYSAALLILRVPTPDERASARQAIVKWLPAWNPAGILR